MVVAESGSGMTNGALLPFTAWPKGNAFDKANTWPGRDGHRSAPAQIECGGTHVDFRKYALVQADVNPAAGRHSAGEAAMAATVMC